MSNSNTNGDSTMANTSDAESGNVKVIVRVRPPNDLERNAVGRHVVEVMNENVLVFDPKEQSSPVALGRKRRHRDIRKRRQKDMTFAFDHVFGWDSTTEELFEQSTKTVIEGLIGGYNCSVFAYGATGAGKTHTMLGTESQPGVIYHTMIHLYKHIKELSEEKSCEIAVSYLEVYNEQIRDLLLPRGTLPIREDPSSGVIITGLSLHKPSTAEELLFMLQFGNKNRTQHPTDANAESSRSHAVFQVFVRQKDRTANISAEVKVGKMCLVDLAGSERATVTKNRGARLREGANINRSLLALGNVINSLADHKYKGHIPYRDSKLTRLLKDSLGGNCRTIMIAAVSPSHLSYEDTYNTLKYADRAKNIRLSMKKNVLSVDFHVSRYGKIVEELRKEITELKGKLQKCERPSVAQTLSLPADLQTLRASLQTAYNDRRALRDQQLQQETNVRDVQWRLHCKHKCLHRASQLTHTQPQTLQKIQGVVSGLQKKLRGQEVQRQTLSQRLQDNTHTLHTLQSQAAAVGTNNPLFYQVLEVSVQKQAVETELNDSRHNIHHLRRLARAQAREAMASETLISALLSVVQRQHLELLSRPGPVASEIATGYQNVCELVGQWGVSWADCDQQGEGDQEPFHINDIIDIPVLTSAGVTLDRLPLSGKHAVAAADTVNKVNAAVNCPGRVVNGQVTFPNTPSVRQPSSSSLTPATCHHAWSSSCDCDGQPPAKSARMDDSHPTSVARSSEDSGDPFDGGDSGMHKTRNVHAGHTPNPQKLWPCSEKKPGLGQVSVTHIPTACPQLSQAQSRPVSDYAQKMSKPKAVACVAVPIPDCEVPHNLNETFSMEDCIAGTDSSSCDAGNSTGVLGAPSLLSVPVIEASLSPSAKHVSSSGAYVKGLAQNVQHATADSSTAQSQLHLNSMRIPSVHVSVSPSHKTVCDSDRKLAQSTVGPGSVLLNHSACAGGCATCKTSSSEGDKENTDSCTKQSSHAKRAIIFDGVSLTPQVEGRSYADALKTPTPPRQPLGNLNYNSPLVMGRTLPTAPNQTPKSTGRSSLYLANPQAYDNMRRLKEMGMPSLMENLITGNKTGGSSSQEGSKPSYMQPTKAHAQRVRHQTSFRDDSFQPKRVQHRSLAHSRSKSTSALAKSGWKI
ncbi:kinesin-like protein KIF18A isoform X2 [Littorina saxatilis]|uniref:Kinesin motor domain-containing protein n=2 Tax=Littorina saxatilis TaxID=31220 RepID=A0AAN9B7T3_9CAEN